MPEDKWATQLPNIEKSTSRMYNAEDPAQPASMCWASGGDDEDPVTSQTHERHGDGVRSTPFVATPLPSSNYTYALYTGCGSNWREMDAELYPNLGKM